MFDFGLIFQQLLAGIGELFISRIVALIAGLFGGQPG